MYGTQTLDDLSIDNLSFENDVKMYGTQTKLFSDIKACLFENDVKMYGTQTHGGHDGKKYGLRMM